MSHSTNALFIIFTLISITITIIGSLSVAKTIFIKETSGILVNKSFDSYESNDFIDVCEKNKYKSCLIPCNTKNYKLNLYYVPNGLNTTVRTCAGVDDVPKYKCCA